TAEVEDAFGGRAGTTSTAGTFDNQHIGAGTMGFQGGADAGHTGADDQHITFARPVAHGSHEDGGGYSGHGDSPAAEQVIRLPVPSAPGWPGRASGHARTASRPRWR